MHRKGAATRGGDLRGDRVRAVWEPVHHGDLGAGTRKPLRDHAPDPRTGAGDDHHPAVEPHPGVQPATAMTASTSISNPGRSDWMVVRAGIGSSRNSA